MINDYQGAQVVSLSASEQDALNRFQGKLQQNLVLRGVNPAAAAMLDIQAAAYTLTVSEEERRQGAFHVFADAQPFRVVTVSAPMSLLEMQDVAGQPLLSLSAEQQAAWLAFDIGMNLLQATAKYCETTGTPVTGGGTSSGMPFKSYEFNLRGDFSGYLNNLLTVVDYRLNSILPKADPSSSSKNDGGPKL